MAIRKSLSPLKTIALSAVLVAPALVLATPSSGSAAVGDTLMTSGLNSDGQLGTGNTTNRSSFGAVNNLTNVDEVAGGREHIVALVGGQVYTWGDGSKGATGQGSSADRTTPTLVTGLSGVTNVSTGHYHSLALLSNGTVRAWGFNSMGQLGDGTTINRNRPVTVRLPTGRTALDIVAGRDMSYALLDNRTVWAWGGGANGELGNNSSTAKQTTPVQVTGLTDIIAIAGGRNHGLALKSDGTVWAWGLNAAGRLGDNTTTTRRTPVKVQGLTAAVTAISAGADHSVALLNNGQVMTWGEASRGQLGLGNTTDRRLPVRVMGIPAIKHIGCGRDTTLAVSTTGELWDWGFNDYGQLGLGTTATRLSPIQVPGVANAIEAHGGRGYTVVRVAAAARR